MNHYTVKRPAEDKPNVLVSSSEAEMLKKVYDSPYVITKEDLPELY